MTRKDKILIAVGVAVAALIYVSGCKHGQNSILKQTGSDTTITRDSVVVRYKPVPYKVVKHDTIRMKGKNDIGFFQEEGNYVESFEMESDPDISFLNDDFNETAYYSDTIRLKRGSAIITDTVTGNRIAGRKLELFNVDTTIKTTTVLRPPRNTVGYFTLSGSGNMNKDIGVGFGLGLKNRNDRVYQIEVKKIAGLPLIYEGRVMFPIRLFKK